MVSHNDPYTTDRPRALFSPRDRRYLTGEMDVTPHTQQDREIRGDLRERMWNGLLDFVLLYNHVEERDVAQSIGEPGSADLELARDGGIACVLALLFKISTEGELTATGQFEQYLENAVRQILDKRQLVEEDGLYVGDADVNITVDLPTTINNENLAEKVVAVWDRMMAVYDESWKSDPTQNDPVLEIPHVLDQLRADEVLFLWSEVVEGDGEVDETLESADAALRGVIRMWTHWRFEGTLNPEGREYILRQPFLEGGGEQDSGADDLDQ